MNNVQRGQDHLSVRGIQPDFPKLANVLTRYRGYHSSCTYHVSYLDNLMTIVNCVSIYNVELKLNVENNVYTITIPLCLNPSMSIWGRTS